MSHKMSNFAVSTVSGMLVCHFRESVYNVSKLSTLSGNLMSTKSENN